MTAPVGSLAAYLSVRGAAQARQDILSVQRQLGLAGDAAVAAGGALDRSEAALAGVGRASTVTAGRANQLRAAQLGVVAATERYNAVLADEGATVGRVATSEASLIRAKERLASVTRVAAAEQAKATEVTRSAALANAEMVGSSSRGAAAMGGTVKQLGLMLGGFELLKKGVDIGKETAEFQRNMLLIQTNANASAGEVKNMTDAVLKLSPEVATAPNELAKALYHIEQNGHGLLNTAQMMDALRVGAEGAKIGMADVEDTTNTMTIALASGITGMGSMQQAMGRMIAIAGTGDMRLKDLNEALSTGILSVAKGFGATMGDVAAVLATLGDNGIRGADASTALRQTLMGFAQPAKGGAEALQSVGLAMHDLRDDMEKHGLVHAMNDLEKHMTAAGITGSKVGGFITEAFGRKAGAGISVLMGEIGRLNIKFDEGAKGAASFGDKWKATTQTAAFAFHKLGAEFDAAGIRIATKALPAITAIGSALGTILPAAIHAAAAGMVPFIAGWHALSGILPPVAHALEDVGGFLAPLLPALKFVASDVLAMWVAFKGYQAARYAINAVADMFATVKARSAAGLASVQAYGTGVNATLAGNATESQLTSRIMQADFARIEAAALEAQAAIDKAAMNEAISFADVTAASKASSDAQVANAERAAAAATAQARASAAAAKTSAAAATAAAADVDAAGEAAAIGWSAVLGPLAAVGIGVALLVSMFHRSSGASKEAAAAAKAYTDALHDDGAGTKATLVETIVKQLSDNNTPQKIADLNKALGSTAFSGRQFVDAISAGGKPLADLRKRLEDVIKTGSTVVEGTGRMAGAVVHLTPAAKSATAALKDLNDQAGGLSKAAKKEIADYKQLGVVVTPMAKIAEQLHLGSGAAQRYAQMLDLAVSKSGNLLEPTDANKAHIKALGDEFNNASQTADGLLTAMDSFSKSAGTASDRAAMIGATLKAANGDALGYASAMTGAFAANKALVDGFQADASSIADLKAQIADLTGSTKGSSTANQVLAATINKTSTSLATNKDRIKELKAEIASGKLSTSQLAAAHRELANAQASGGVSAARLTDEQKRLQAALGGGKVDAKELAKLQTQLAAAYANSELAAINLNKGTIDYSKGGAPALVGQLQSIQDASMKAAGATFQHELATQGAAKAADDAYKQYRTQTEGTLIDEAKKLGLTHDQAKKLADTYFGLADAPNIEKTIKALGTDPVVNVLDRIGRLLAKLTGTQWDIPVNIVTRGKLPHAAPTDSKGQVIGPGYASGTTSASAGLHWVGEHGPELLAFRGGEKVIPNGPATKLSRTVVIQKLEVNQTYPLPDTGKIGLAHAMTAAEHAIGGI